MNPSQIKSWLRKTDSVDSWWYSINKSIAEQPAPLDSILRETPRHASLQILHVSQSNEPEPPWIPVDDLSSSQSPTSQKRIRLVIAGTIAAACIAVITTISIVAGNTASSNNPSLQTLERDPPLRVRVGRSEWMLFVYNGNLDPWKTITVELVHDSITWTYHWQNTLQPDQTLQIPLRDFQTHHDDVSIRDFPPNRLRILVPGFAPFEQRFR